MKVCKNCGSNVLDTDEYCQVCGFYLSGDDSKKTAPKKIKKVQKVVTKEVKTDNTSNLLNVFTVITAFIGFTLFILQILSRSLGKNKLVMIVSLAFAIISIFLGIISSVKSKKFNAIIILAIFLALARVPIYLLNNKTTKKVYSKEESIKTNNIELKYNPNVFFMKVDDHKTLYFKENDQAKITLIGEASYEKPLDMNNNEVQEKLFESFYKSLSSNNVEGLRLKKEVSIFKLTPTGNYYAKIRYTLKEKINGAYVIEVAKNGDYYAVFNIFLPDAKTYENYLRYAEKDLATNLKFLNTKEREVSTEVQDDRKTYTRGNMKYKLSSDFKLSTGAQVPYFNNGTFTFFKYKNNPVYLIVTADSVGADLGPDAVYDKARNNFKILSNKVIEGSPSWNVITTEAFEFGINKTKDRFNNQKTSSANFTTCYTYNKGSGILYRFTVMTNMEVFNSNIGIYEDAMNEVYKAMESVSFIE